MKNRTNGYYKIGKLYYEAPNMFSLIHIEIPGKSFLLITS